MDFKSWLQYVESGVGQGGLPPPEERPVDAAVKMGHCGAFPTYSADKTDLPPTPKHPRMKKAMKKK